MDTQLLPARKFGQRAQAKQRTREKILSAARQLFLEKGYEGTTIRDISAAAGMSTGAVFASFADKAALFQQVVKEEFTRREDVARVNSRPSELPRTKSDFRVHLVGLFGSGYQHHPERLLWLRIIIQNASTENSPAYTCLQKHRKVLIGEAAKVIDREVGQARLPAWLPSPLFAEMCYSVFVGAILSAAEDFGGEEVDVVFRGHIDALFSGHLQT